MNIQHPRARKRSALPEDYPEIAVKRQRIMKPIELANLPGWVHNQENNLRSEWVSLYKITTDHIIVVTGIRYIVFQVISFPHPPYAKTALIASSTRLIAKPITSQDEYS